MKIEYERSNPRFAFGGAEFSSEKTHWREKSDDKLLYRRSQLSVGILHWHENLEVCKLVKGDAVFTIEDKKYKFSEGDIVIIPGKSLHMLECEGDHLADVFLIPLHKSRSVITEFPAVPCFITHEQITAIDGLEQEINYLFERINCEFSDKKPYYASIAFAYALNVICVLSRNFNIQKIQRVKNAEILEPVLNEIRTDATNAEYSLSYFAKKLGYTTEYFSYIFKEYAGVGFKSFLDRQRIEEAKRIMVQSDVSISQLAIICGYNNVRTFNNRFKELENMNPSQFQKTVSKRQKSFKEII
ncbi:MAG: helix-turn-helix domain-containing protein [Ruminococcaceae bacterium]|nr:helix-turn-helix domain-containing protein [Oscillospiraceae bacterium]